MIGFLRFVGALNAAVWLGAAVFYTVGAAPALVSQDMRTLLQSGFPYYSVAVAQILMMHYFRLHVACAAIALLHLAAEWLYLGRPAQKLWLGLLSALFALSLVGNLWLCPKLSQLHQTRSLGARLEERAAAAKSFGTWRAVFQTINVLLLGGAAVYLWRVTHPTDSLRFVGSAQFRG